MWFWSYYIRLTRRLWRFEYIPLKWKHATIVAIPKKYHRFPQNYRPTGLLNTWSKLAEKAIHKLLLSFCSFAKIIPKEPFDFREGHSTTHQLLRVVEHIVGGFNHGKHIGAVFLDAFKAFDKVGHNGLLYKLLNIEFPLCLFQIIGS